jgi:hypothetical protein
VPKTILMEIPSKLIPDVKYTGELKVNIASSKPKESIEPTNNKVQEKKTKFSLFK